jgi:starvation-inducible DNA-binding protein
MQANCRPKRAHRYPQNEKGENMTDDQPLILRNEELGTPTDLSADAVRDISAALRALLADTFALYLKTKNYHWHMSGPHFRDYHLLLDEQSDQIFAMTDPIAERGRKIGGSTIHSVGEIKRLQRLLDNDEPYVTPRDMLAELHGDNKQLVSEMRRTHELCEQNNDVATASLIEVWIDETERRAWFLYESTRTTEG